MASTYSTNLRVELMANGENSTTWGSKTNVNLNLLEQAISGVASVAMTDADYTLTTSNALADEARNAVVTMTGTLTQARNVIVPSVDKQYVFKNSTTGGFSIVVKTAAGTGITVLNGETEVLYCDATNVLRSATTPTGSGAPVRATSPTLVTPNLGTPSALVGTNITGTAAGLTAGAASAVAVGGITGLGTGVATALAVNVGTAGAPVVLNGALGTPSSGVATNLTGTASGLTAGTASAVAVGGITGLGTGVATALAANVGSAGAPVVFNGALGTPSSGVATNLTGTAAGLTAGVASAVAVGGVTGLGTNVATALGVAIGSAGAVVVNGGALGTPSSGTLSGCSGLPAAGVAGTALTAAAAVTVAQGGTGRATSTTAYGLIAAGTTATGAHQTLAAGATTELLVGGGASALPVWTAATGSGAPVRATSPTLVTPVLGTPASGTLTNCDGTAANLVSGATNALKSATTTVNVSSATAPSSGQVLTATGASTATWQTPSVAAGIPTGTIIDFGGSAAPTGYLACDGTAVSRTTYAALFAAVGTLWGSGDGSTTFNLPNISAGYATVQTAGTVGASTTGEIKAHTHVVGSSAGAASGSFGFVAGDTGATTSASTGGAANKAAGVYVLKCIKT